MMRESVLLTPRYAIIIVVNVPNVFLCHEAIRVINAAHSGRKLLRVKSTVHCRIMIPNLQ